MTDLTEASVEPDIQTELQELRALVRQQQARLEDLEQRDGSPEHESRMSRRAMFGLAGAGVIGAAVAGSATPAAAADGDNMVLGTTNVATSLTALLHNGASGEGLIVQRESQTGTATALQGNQVGDAGFAIDAFMASTTNTSAAIQSFNQGAGDGVHVRNLNTTSTAPGVNVDVAGLGRGVDSTISNAASTDAAIHGTAPALGVKGDTSADASIGVHGASTGTGGIGVQGTGAFGVRGLAGSGDAMFGETATGRGVVANATGSGLGLSASSADGVGALVSSVNHVPFQIQKKAGGAAAAAPTTGTHTAGMFYVDSEGDLYYCVEDGSPGTWEQLNGQTESIVQGPTFLSTSQRAYDSRASKGGPGPFAAGETRTIDLTTNTDFPAGSSAVILNLTVVGTTGANGFVSVYSGDQTISGKPSFSNINWFGPNQILANTTTSAAGTAGTVKLYASGVTDVLIDVIGSYPA